jgi:hypothetical protein
MALTCPFDIEVEPMKIVQGLILVVTGLCLSPAFAQHTAEETKEDIVRHRAMATAHGKAAQCLESGKDAKVCLAELQLACKGLGIGKYCGMRHQH